VGNLNDSGYWYHLYLSYERGGLEEEWALGHFKRELTKQLKLELRLSEPPLLYFNEDNSRDPWDRYAMERVRRSCCLVSILTDTYWEAPHCVAEFESFERRPTGPESVGVLLKGEQLVHSRVKTLFNFSDYRYTHEGFPKNDKYTGFVDEVGRLVKQLAFVIQGVPACPDGNWPVAPLPPAPAHPRRGPLITRPSFV
jgi:hypothetical protein